jgi:hypothetical protein
MYAWLKVKPACLRYLAYARRTITSSGESAAPGVSRLKPSLSISRRATRASASSVIAFTACTSGMAAPLFSPKSCTNAASPCTRSSRHDDSSSTSRPMFSSTGRLPESGTGAPSR